MVSAACPRRIPRIARLDGGIRHPEPLPRPVRAMNVFWKVSEMPVTSSSTYQFGSFRLEVGERRLLREGSIVPLRTKVFDTLCVLVAHSGRLLTKHELMHSIWPDTA